jgi:hypothetical protein
VSHGGSRPGCIDNDACPSGPSPRSSHCTLDATKTISDVLGSTPEMHVICPSIYSVPAFRLMRPSPLPTA